MEDRKAQALRTERERKIRSQEGMVQEGVAQEGVAQEGVAQAQSPVPGAFDDESDSDF